MADHQYIDDEIDLVDYLQVLLKRKWLIIFVIALCFLGGLAKMFLDPIRYSSEALILLSPNYQLVPQNTDETQTPEPQLDVETYAALAKSDELVTTLRDSVNHFLQTGDIHNADNFSYSLSSELLQPTATGQSPLLSLQVISSDSSAARFIANYWSDLFLKRHQGLNSGAAKNYYEWVKSQYDIAAQNLEQAEDSLQFIKSTYHELSILQNEINIKNANLEKTLTSYQAQQIELQAKQKEVEHLRNVLKELTLNGKWIGFYNADELPKNIPLGSALKRDLIGIIQALGKLEQDSLRLVRDHLNESQSMALKEQNLQTEFEKQTGISIAKSRLTFLNTTLLAYHQEAAEQDQKQRELLTQIIPYQQQLEEQPPVLVLSKAITDDALWNSLQSNKGLNLSAQEKLDAIKIRTEEHNPIYLRLSEQMSTLKLEKEILQNRLAFIAQEVPKLEESLSDLTKHLDTLQIQEQNLRHKLNLERQSLTQKMIREKDPILTVLSLHREAFQRHRQYYISRQRQLGQLEQDLILQQADYQFAKRNFETHRIDLSKQNDHVQELQLTRTRLERNIVIYQKTFTQFAGHLEDARIAQQQASGDIQIVSRASTYQRLSSKTSTTLIISIVIGVFVSIFLSFCLEYLQKAKERLA